MTLPRFVRVLLTLVGLPAAIWLGGLVWFVDGLDDGAASPVAATDAIVVLTGGSQRVESGLTLLLDGKAKKLFVSGVHPGVDRRAMFPGEDAAAGWIDCCVVLGHSADNTVGNAVETAQWLKAEGYSSLRLVTANYHMKRALLEFRRVLPPEDVIVPDPVVPEATRHGGVLGWRGTLHIVVVEYMKYLGALVRPLILPNSDGAATSHGAA